MWRSVAIGVALSLSGSPAVSQEAPLRIAGYEMSDLMNLGRGHMYLDQGQAVTVYVPRGRSSGYAYNGQRSTTNAKLVSVALVYDEEQRIDGKGLYWIEIAAVTVNCDDRTMHWLGKNSYWDKSGAHLFDVEEQTKVTDWVRPDPKTIGPKIIDYECQ